MFSFIIEETYSETIKNLPNMINNGRAEITI